jgi:hypothetical protein
MIQQFEKQVCSGSFSPVVNWTTSGTFKKRREKRWGKGGKKAEKKEGKRRKKGGKKLEKVRENVGKKASGKVLSYGSFSPVVKVRLKNGAKKKGN